MTDAPEKIWLTGFVKDEYGARLGRGTISDLDHGTNPEYPGYTRTDLHLALVAAAYEGQHLEFGKLGWGRAERDGMNLQSDTPFGRYYIAARSDGVWLWWRPASGPAHHGSATSEQDAMEQCQRDYEARLSQAVAIRALTPTDAQAALERMKREAQNEALREAAASIWRHRQVVPVSFLEAMEANILALMEDTDDE